MDAEKRINRIKRIEYINSFNTYYKEELSKDEKFEKKKKGQQEKKRQSKRKKETTDKLITPQQAYEREKTSLNNVHLLEGSERGRVREFKKTLNQKAGYKKYSEAQEYSAKIEERRYQERNSDGRYLGLRKKAETGYSLNKDTKTKYPNKNHIQILYSDEIG